MDSAGKLGLHGGSFVNPWIVQESVDLHGGSFVNPWIVQESLIFMVVLLLTHG